jgi:rubrerythrin
MSTIFKLPASLSRASERAVWKDPARAVRTLESFSATESDGGKDILAALRRITDPELRDNLTRHADDEVRHAELFRRRAAELRTVHGLAAHGEKDFDRMYDLSRGRPAHEVDAHGFFTAGLCDEMGEVAYVAMLHVAELRAKAFFERQRDFVGDDRETRAIFEEILRDEKFHASYTGNFLKRWRQQGRGREVKAGLRAARGNRFLGGWKRFGARSAGTFGRTVLLVLYATLFMPFGLLARRGKEKPSWRPPSTLRGMAKMRSQYG